MANILIVDDQPTNREVLTTLLGYRGHHLLEASDGAEALQVAGAQHPDLVITDLLMPVMDGYELVKQLRADSSIAHTPVIYYTAHYLEREARALAQKSGVIHILTKPFEPEQALSMVDAALGLAAEPTPLPAPEPEQFDREHLTLVTNKLSQKAAELRLANLRFQALIELGRRLNTESDPSALVMSYCRATREIVGAGLSLILLGGSGDPARRVFASGFGKSRVPDCFQSSGIFRNIESQGAPRRIAGLEGAPLETGVLAGEIEISSLLASPIASPQRQYGWLYAFNKLGSTEFSELEEQLAAMLAGQLAVAYEKARLYEEAEREVAERKRAEESVRQKESQYRLLMEQASDGIAIFDERGCCIEANPVFCRMLGYGRQDLSGKKLEDLIPEGDAAFDPAHGSGPEIRQERRMERRDGACVLTEIGASVLQDGRVQLIVRDISGRKALEEQREQAQKALAAQELAETRAVLVEELERKNRELEAFSYSISHDLRAPLRRIDGFSTALLEDYADALDAKGREHLDRVKTAARRMGELIDDLLNLARVSRADLQHQQVNLSALARAVVAELQTNSPERRVQALIADGIVVQADRRLLRVLLENLLGNAWKFTSKVAEPVIELGVAQPNGVPSYFVRDNGAGFDMAHVQKLFTPFQRLHPESRFPGTGIGLATVQKIVDRHGGRVWAEAAVEKGATFFWTLPPEGSARLT